MKTRIVMALIVVVVVVGSVFLGNHLTERAAQRQLEQALKSLAEAMKEDVEETSQAQAGICLTEPVGYLVALALTVADTAL